MPRLRRLLDPRPDAEGDARLRHPEGEHRVHLGHRLLQPVSVLHEHLRLPHDPRPRAGDRDRPQGRAAGPQVWVITGDGDALSIGGNHLIHAMRRNVDIKIVLFNNRIYGLTKGQSSPDVGARQEDEVDADGLDRLPDPAAGGRARRRGDVRRALGRHRHRAPAADARGAPAATGAASFVEVLQNCNIFNDGAWRDFTDREVRDDRMLILEHGKPMIFGKERDKGIRLNGLQPEVVTIGEDGVTEADLLVHDEHAEDPHLAFMLSRMYWPEFPVPVGVLRDVTRPTHPT